MQNKIQKVGGLEGLARLRNLELAANRIRVRSACSEDESSGRPPAARVLRPEAGDRKP